MFMDSDQASDKKAQSYRTEFMVYIKAALIFWFSKKQSTVETLIIAEYVAMENFSYAVKCEDDA